MTQPLTVVLPMHNCERRLRSSVLDILDLAPLVSMELRIVVVDDGSVDDTYDIACELARLFPQLMVFRQPVRQGIGAALDLVRNRLRVEMVLVHDGISPIDAAQLQTLLQAERGQAGSSEKDLTLSRFSATESSGSRRFASVRLLHDRMEHAHRSVASFRWVQLEKPLVPRRCRSIPPAATEVDA